MSTDWMVGWKLNHIHHPLSHFSWNIQLGFDPLIIYWIRWFHSYIIWTVAWFPRHLFKNFSDRFFDNLFGWIECLWTRVKLIFLLIGNLIFESQQICEWIKKSFLVEWVAIRSIICIQEHGWNIFLFEDLIDHNLDMRDWSE